MCLSYCDVSRFFILIVDGKSLFSIQLKSEVYIQCLAKVFGPLELCDLLPHFRLQT